MALSRTLTKIIFLIFISLPLLLSANNSNLVNIGLGKALSATSEYSSVYNASKASDGDMNTAWGSSLSNNPQWIYINLQDSAGA